MPLFNQFMTHIIIPEGPELHVIQPVTSAKMLEPNMAISDNMWVYKAN